MRRHHALKGLMRAGRVDIVVAKDVDDDELAMMRRAYGVAVVSAHEGAREGRSHRFRRRLPRRVELRDPGALCRLVDQRDKRYDGVFIERVDDLLLLDSALAVPIVVDLDDLDTQVLVQQRRLLWRNATSAPSRRFHRVPAAVRRPLLLAARVPTTAFRYATATIELRRWRRAERRAVTTSAVALACSRDDARSLMTPHLSTARQSSPRVPLPNILVVPNGFDREGEPTGQLEVGDPPTMAFWGSFDYLPNVDGARWFLEAVLPELHRTIPSLNVLFIGRDSERLRTADERVQALGFVLDLTPYLRQTHVAIVPLRIGGGTRIKIVEAWAHGIPVVSTSVGAHGLDAVSGREILIADRPDDFAASTLAALQEIEVRRTLRKEGLLRAEALGWDSAERSFEEAMRTAMATRPGAQSIRARKRIDPIT